MITNHKTASGVILAALLFQTTAFAAGLKVNVVSTSAMGTANAGRGALLEDASVVYYNPAATAMFENPLFSGGFFFANLDAKLSNITATDEAGNPIVAGQGNFDDGGDFMPEGLGPFIYYLHPVANNMTVSFGLYPSFSTESRYSNNAVVGLFATATKFQAVALQPNIAYKINDQLSVGLGLEYLLAEGELSQQAQAKAGDGFRARVVVTGDDTAIGYNLSAFWQPHANTSIGLVWHAPVDIVLRGDGEFITRQANGSWQLQGKEEGGKVPINLPMSIDFSLNQKITDKLSAQLGVLWMQWSVFEKLDVIGNQGGGIISSKANLGAQALEEGLIAHVPTKWLDTTTVSIGTTYQLNDQYRLRAGFMYDQDTSKKGKDAIARVPSSEQYWLTAGLGYRYNKNLSFDAGAAYILPVKAKIYETDNDLNGNPKSNAMVRANSQIDVINVSAQLNYQF